MVPVRLKEWVGRNAGLEYFRVSLFERDHTGNVSRTVVNMGREVDAAGYILMLPWLKENKYVETDDLSWTFVGAEYERLSQNGSLQSVYNLPINLQNSQGTNPISAAAAEQAETAFHEDSDTDDLYYDDTVATI
jgi:hypothetical protein